MLFERDVSTPDVKPRGCDFIAVRRRRFGAGVSAFGARGGLDLSRRRVGRCRQLLELWRLEYFPAKKMS
jgi:hypothetical protein